MNLLTYAFALALASSPAYAQVFKCVQGGKTTYSNAPCDPAATSKQLQGAPMAPSGLSQAAEQIRDSTFNTTLDKQLEELNRRIEELNAEQETRRQAWLDSNPDAPDNIRFAVKYRQAQVGMDEDAALASLGYPGEKRRHTFSGGETAWWHYEIGSKRLSLHFKNGVVDSVHE